MFSWWNKKITLYHKSVNAESGMILWTRDAYDHCFWKGKLGQTRVALAEHGEHRVLARIPADNILVNTGDIVVLGTVTDTIDEYTDGARSKDLLKRYGDDAFIVELYQCNAPDETGLTHWRLEGS